VNKENNILELTDIEKSFVEGRQRMDVLKGISLEICHGKWYTVYGASGSGKTTLLNVIGGLEKPDKGKYLYSGTDVYDMSDASLSNWRNSKIGFVFQFFYLIAELNVEENIFLPLSISGKKPDRDWFDKITGMLKMKDLLKRHPLTLSGGEKQRVAMARAVINKPDFIIADEPTGNLDTANSDAVIELMNVLKDEADVGVILATHERNLIGVGDYNLYLENGILKDIKE
jgi:putative ABC transport system ATP-binding protein